jgi:hypothetical protein
MLSNIIFYLVKENEWQLNLLRDTPVIGEPFFTVLSIFNGEYQVGAPVLGHVM